VIGERDRDRDRERERERERERRWESVEQGFRVESFRFKVLGLRFKV
jgi:hypothetical protein